ncbi:uncharacterized protein LOC128220477 isoform X2 [Mya arenaria]|uniref:uncharacterized protein LOC128220477 isoform X2 n=1 Tax=Mya arenaria TaxID=6604 RepID=UPI0022E4F7BE|nr:uncharacterized protein LOC128220477 isoform X2 [Mya arenaria]
MGSSEKMPVEAEPKNTNGENACQEDSDVDEPEEDNRSHLPIDRGWAWIIMLATMLNQFIIIGQMKCFGIVFVQLQERFQASSSATSVIFTLQNVTYSLTALVVMTVGSGWSARKTIISGSLMSVGAYFLAGFLTDVRQAYLVLGVLIGGSTALINPNVLSMLSIYFNKRRGLANNICNSGVSMGGLVFAPIYTALFVHYAFTGTYIFIAGFHLHLLIIGCLMRPLSFYERRRKECHSSDAGTEDIAENIEEKEHLIEQNLYRDIKRCTHQTSEQKHFGSSGAIEMETVRNGILKRQVCSIDGHGRTSVRRRTHSESGPYKASMHSLTDSIFNTKTARFMSTDIINSSCLDLAMTKTNHSKTTESSSKRETNTRGRKIRTSVLWFLKRLFDIKLLSKPPLLYYLLCNIFLCSGSALVGAFLPPHAFEMGIDKDRVAWIVSGQCIVDFSARFVFAYLSDKSWVQRSTLIAGACTFMGICAQFAFFMTDYPTIMVFSMIVGFLQGVYFSLFVVVILDILTIEDFKSASEWNSVGSVGFHLSSTGSIDQRISPVCRVPTGHYRRILCTASLHRGFTYDRRCPHLLPTKH